MTARTVHDKFVLVIKIIPTAIIILPQQIILAELRVIRLDDGFVVFTGRQEVMAAPGTAGLTLLAAVVPGTADFSIITKNWVRIKVNRAIIIIGALYQGSRYSPLDPVSYILVRSPYIFIRSIIMILLVAAVVMLQGRGVAGGSSCMMFTADQVVSTVSSGVAADSSQPSAAPRL